MNKAFHVAFPQKATWKTESTSLINGKAAWIFHVAILKKRSGTVAKKETMSHFTIKATWKVNFSHRQYRRRLKKRR